MREFVFCQVFHCQNCARDTVKLASYCIIYFHPVVLSEDSSSEEDDLERGKKKTFQKKKTGKYIRINCLIMDKLDFCIQNSIGTTKAYSILC